MIGSPELFHLRQPGVEVPGGVVVAVAEELGRRHGALLEAEVLPEDDHSQRSQPGMEVNWDTGVGRHKVKA